MTGRGVIFSTLLGIAVGAAAWWAMDTRPPVPWTVAEQNVLSSLSIDALGPLPPDPSNAVADDPLAAAFGMALFFDTRMSPTGTVSCATCHQPDRAFSDGLPQGQGLGLSKRNTPSIVAAAYSPWLYWDGRRDSLWSQALSPLEDPAEHGGNRLQLVRLMSEDPSYRRQYEALFDPLPDFSVGNWPDAASPIGSATQMENWLTLDPADRNAINQAYANLGKSLAAYERRLVPGRSRFDDYVAAVLASDTASAQSLFSDDEVRGLRLFIGRGACTQCHNGPLFTNHEFHNTGALSAAGTTPDKGRSVGVRLVMADPFNCRGDYTDADPANCPELDFARTGQDLIGALRTPSLRNVEHTSPYLHKGQLATLAQVLDHYNRAPLAMIGHNEAKPLGMGPRDRRRLELFLNTLSAPTADHRPPAESGSPVARRP